MLQFSRESSFRLGPPQGYKDVLDDPTATQEPEDTIVCDDIDTSIGTLVTDNVIRRVYSALERGVVRDEVEKAIDDLVTDDVIRLTRNLFEDRSEFNLSSIQDTTPRHDSVSSQFISGMVEPKDFSDPSDIHERGTDEAPDPDDLIHIQNTWDPEAELSKAA